MKTKQYTYKTKEQLLKLSDKELKEYLDFLSSEVERIKRETAIINAESLQHKLKVAEMRGEIKRLDQQNAELVKKHGWEGITNDELHWLMDGGMEKYWPQGKYFSPDLPD